jgi:hypothetical protein
MTTQITTTNYLHSIDEALPACAAANSEWQSFDNQLAAAVAWSLANRFQYFWSELLLVDHPKNPRRARSADESAERTLRLEGICDETLGLLSVMAAHTTSTLLPEASRYFPTEANRVEDSAVSRRPPRRDPETIKQRIQVSSRRLQQLETSRKSRSDELAELRQEVRTDNGAQGRAALDDALTNCRGWDADDISPRLAVKVFEVILGKLDQYTQRLYAEALNNPVDAIAEEAEGQFDVLEDVRQRLGVVAYHAKVDAETSRFEPASQAA